LARFFASVGRIAEAEYIIDSSGDPVYTLLLSQLPGITCRVIHLVRDPRAVTFSWAHRPLKQEFDDAAGLAQVPVGRSSWWWLRHNLLTQLVPLVADSYTFVRYEDFARDPDVTLGRICEQTGLGPLPEMDGTMCLEPSPTHLLSGNARLLFAEDTIRITADERWKTESPISEARRATLICLPLLLGYRYPISVGREFNGQQSAPS